LQRGDGRANRGGGAIHVVGRTIDYLESKFARLGRSELFGQFRRFTLYPRFVGTDDRANVLGRCFGFADDPLSSQTRARSASDTIANWKIGILPVSDDGHLVRRWLQGRQPGRLSAESGWKPNFPGAISDVECLRICNSQFV